MVDMEATDDFFEDDEPQDRIEAAFDHGEKHLTQRPPRPPAVAFSRNETLNVQGSIAVSGTVAAAVTRSPR